jgi:HK97 family phage major capsid protein
MNRVLELRQEREFVLSSAEAVLAGAEKEKRAELTTEEKTTLEQAKIRAASIQDQIDVITDIALLRNKAGKEGNAYKDTNEAPKKRSFGEFLRDVAAITQNRAPSGMNTKVDSEGGFLVDETVQSDLMARAMGAGTVARNCRVIPLSGPSNVLAMKAIDETSRADGSRFGGVQAFWGAESETVTKSAPKFRKTRIELEKLFGLAYVTEEALQDADQLEAVVTDCFIKEIAFKLDEGVMRGSGAGQPLGILNSSALVSQAAEGGQTATTVNAANVAKMFGRMYAPSNPNARWYINQDVFQQLPQMSISNMPVFLPPGGYSANPFGTLMGRPIEMIEQCSTLGTLGDIFFADMSQYLLVKKGDVVAASSMHVRFLNDEQVYKFTMRVNGAPAWNAALTPNKGSNTQSPFIALAAR